MKFYALLATCAGIIVAASHAEAAATETPLVCRNLIDDDANGHADNRGVTTTDLIGLRDIGPNFGTDLPKSPLALSPDGKHVAFVLSRADPALNDYCQALVTIDSQNQRSLKILDMTRGLIDDVQSIRGFRTTNGTSIINNPHWSPDGQHLAYLVLVSGIPQARVISVDSASVVFTTTSETAVREIGWTSGGRLLFGHEPEAARLEADIDQRGHAGFLYDDSFVPNRAARPSIPAPIPIRFQSLTASGGDLRLATIEEMSERVERQDDRTSKGLVRSVPGSRGLAAQLVRRDWNSLSSPTDLWIQHADGRRERCDDPACASGIQNMWWIEGAKRLLFLRRAGWGNSELQFYSWDMKSAPKAILKTEDLITGCRLASDTLICLHEASNQPRRIVRINSDSGARTILFDPNPSFRGLRVGGVQRLRWRNSIGIECFGDLVLPQKHSNQSKIPLIVVQYLTRGFLRGGVGDEYPIFPLAEQDFAVLSLQRPADYYMTIKDGSIRTALDARAINQRDWNDRRSVHSALMNGIALVESRGGIDTGRIGITGLSDGVSTVQFALVNAPGRFAAASISTGFQEPKSTQIYGGSAWAKQLIAMGYPPLSDDQTHFWSTTSIERNVDKFNLPILMQVSDNEYLMAMESYGILKANNRPTELYIFPNENHIKTGPAHRFAIYERNIDWFKFWLNHEEDPSAKKKSTYDRWRAMAAQKNLAP